MIRSALIALDQGNKTGNYTVLRDLGAPGFQTNTAAKLAEIFAVQRHDNIDLSGIVVLEPQFSILPEIESNGMLRMAGFFPSVPTQLNFDLLFAPVNGQWRLFGISTNLGQAAPTPPNPQPVPVENKPAPVQKQLKPAMAKPIAPRTPATDNAK